jgi:hypothetical protein
MTLITFIAAFFAVLGWILPALIKVQALMPVFIIGSAVIAIGLVIADPIVQERRRRKLRAAHARHLASLPQRQRIRYEPAAPLSDEDRKTFDEMTDPIRDEIDRESA